MGASSSNPCANGPGTCAQCRADPNSTLFCKSLAASRSQSQSQAPAGCCGGRGADGGCCQSQPQPEPSTDAVPLPPLTRGGRKTRSSARPTQDAAAASRNADAEPPQPTANNAAAHRTVTLTCADAYTTLSRHPAYERASAEITSWMPKLHASDSPVPPGSSHGGTTQKGRGKGVDHRDGRPRTPARPAMEIDAANVMAVLRDFDRRFGREG